MTETQTSQNQIDRETPAGWELKALKIHEGLSQETLAMTANIYRNGKKVGQCENAGHGGPYQCWWDDRAKAEEWEAVGKAFDPEPYGGWDILIPALIEEHELQRITRKNARNGAPFTLVGYSRREHSWDDGHTHDFEWTIGLRALLHLKPVLDQHDPDAYRLIDASEGVGIAKGGA